MGKNLNFMAHLSEDELAELEELRVKTQIHERVRLSKEAKTILVERIQREETEAALHGLIL